MNKIEGAIHQIRSEQLDAKDDLTDVKSDISDVKSDLSDVKNDQTDIKNDISDIKVDLTDVKNDISDVKDDLPNIKSDISDVKGDLSNAKSDLTNVKNDLADVKGDLPGIKNDLSDAKDDLLSTKSDLSNVKSSLTNIKSDLTSVKNKISNKFDDVTVETEGVLNKITFYSNGVEQKTIDVLGFSQVVPGTLTINYEAYSTVKEKDTVIIPYTFNTSNKGDATLYVSIIVGESTKELEYTLKKVGANSVNLGNLTKGINQLTFYVIDAAGQMTETTTITIVCGALELTSTFDDSLDYSAYSNITIPLTVSALDANETMTLKVDIGGAIYEKQVFNGYNTFSFPNEFKIIGVHHVSMQVVGGKFQSETLEYNIVIADSSRILLSSTTDSYTVEEGYDIEIPYRISIVGQTIFHAKYYINNVFYSEAEVKLGKNTYQGDYRRFPVGSYTLTIEVSTIDGTIKSTMNLLIKVENNAFKRITHVTAGLQAYFNMSSKSNTNVDKDVLLSEVKTDKDTTAKLVLHDYNFSSNGWIDGRLVSNGKAWAEIVDYLPLEDNAIGGFTFDILFSSNNMGDNNAKVVDCTGSATPFPGFFIDSEKAVLTTDANELTSYYTDKEDMRVTFIVNRTSTYYEEYITDENGNSVLNPNPTYKPNPMVQTFINGIFTDVAMLSDQGSGATKIYENIMNTEQILINTDKNKQLFGNSKIKSIRIYNRPLEHEEVLQNYMADHDDLMEQKAIYDKNYVTVNSDIPTLYFYDTDIGKCDLMTKDTKQWVNIVYTSPNKDLFGESFDLMGQASWQGTSSLAYPVKNYKFKLYDWARDASGAIIESSRNDADTYIKKKVNMYPSDANGYPESTFCLKADYMDSSHCRNTGTARLVNDFLFDGYNNPAKQADPKTRDTINGFPCNLYINGRWMGIFNFNHDKSCTKTLGMETIPNTVRWEIKANSDTSAGAFYKTWTNVEECYAAILADFEIVYDEDAFEDKTGEYDVTKYYDELGFAHDGPVTGSYYDYAILALARFVNFVDGADEEAWLANSDKYFNKVQACRYYLNTMTLGLIDNFAKNCIINMYGDDVWWFSFYDLDSSLGLDNTGYKKFESNIEPSQPGVYNCSTSKMWVKLNEWNQNDLFNQFKAIRENKYTYENICAYLIEKQIDVIPQLLYNKDMYTKYISQGRQYLHMLHGNNKDHLKRWLYNRFQYVDSLFLQHNSPYTKQNITIRSCKPTNATPKYDASGNIISQYTARFEIQTYCPQYVTVCWRKNTYETKRIDFGETVVFEYDMVNSQDNEIILYCAGNLKHIGNCSNLNPTSVDIGNAYRLVEFVVEDSDKLVKADVSKNVYLRRASFKNCSVMGTASGGSNVLDISSCTNLREIDIRGTQITSLVTNTSGGNLEKILYPTAIQTVVVSNQVNLEVLGLPTGNEVATNLTNVQIINCNNIKTLEYPYDEANPVLRFNTGMKHVQSLTLDNSLGITSLDFNNFANLKNLSIKNMMDLELLGFDNMLSASNTGTLSSVSLTNLPKVKKLTLNCTSEDYAVKFADGAVLDLTGLTALEDLESNCSIKGLDKIIIPSNLKSISFTKTYGEGTCDIKRIYSSDSLGDHGVDNLECIDLKGVNININANSFRISNLLKISVIKNIYYAPVTNDDKPSFFYEGRNGTAAAPYLNIYGTYDISNFTGSVDYLFNRLNIADQLTVVNNTAIMPQTDLSYMFADCIASESAINNILSHFSNITKMSYMFYNAKIDSLALRVDSEKVTDMIGMFDSCSCANISLDNVDLGHVMHMGYAFRNCSKLTSLDLSNCNISYLNSCDDIFIGCTSLEELNVSNIKVYRNTSVARSILNSLSESPIQEVIMNSWDLSDYTNLSSLFNNCTYTGKVVMNNWDLSNSTTLSYAFNNAAMKELIVSNWKIPNVTDMTYMFSGCNSLISIDISSFDTSNVTDMRYMFYDCKSLTSLDLSGFKTSSVTSMSYMFYNCKSLTSIDVSDFDTSNVTSMFNMFNKCESLISLDLSKWNTDKLNDVGQMFSGCSALTSLDLSGWNTSKVTTFSSLFLNCGSLVTITGIENWDTSNAIYMPDIFSACYKVRGLNLSNWNVSKVTNMSRMFYGYAYSNTESLDLSNWDVSNVTNMTNMFKYCKYLYNFNAPKNIKVSVSFSDSTSLDYNSLMSIINNLASVTSTQTLDLSSTSLNKLATSDIAIATNKGWSVV